MGHGSPPISAAQQWSSSSRSCLPRYTSGGHDGAILDAILGLRLLMIAQRWSLFWATLYFFLVLYAGPKIGTPDDTVCFICVTDLIPADRHFVYTIPLKPVQSKCQPDYTD